MNDMTQQLFDVLKDSKLSDDKRYIKVKSLIEISKQMEKNGFDNLAIPKKGTINPINPILSDATDKFQVSIMALASLFKYPGVTQILQLLMDEGFSYKEHNHNQPSAFMVACFLNNIAAVKFFLIHNIRHDITFSYIADSGKTIEINLYKWVKATYSNKPIHNLLMAKKNIDAAIIGWRITDRPCLAFSASKFIMALHNDTEFVIDYLSSEAQFCLRAQSLDYRYLLYFIKLAAFIFKDETNPDLENYARLQTEVLSHLLAYDANVDGHRVFENNDRKMAFIKEFSDGAEFESTMKTMSGDNSKLLLDDESDEENMGSSSGKQQDDDHNVDRTSAVELITERKDSPVMSNAAGDNKTKSTKEAAAARKGNHQQYSTISKAI